MTRCSRYFRKMQVAPTRTQMINRPSASGRPGISPGSGVKRTSAQLACSACIAARQWLLPEMMRLKRSSQLVRCRQALDSRLQALSGC
jgi:hypothetical protein